MKLPHPHLIALRSASTVVLSCLVAQAGWAAAFLGQSRRFFVFHQVFAWITLIATLLSMVTYVVLRRTAGRVLLWLMGAVTVMVVAQVILGAAHVKPVHIFLGVLTAMAGTALTSWTYRHPAPLDGAVAAGHQEPG